MYLDLNQTKLPASFFVIVCSSRQTLTEKTIGYKLPILLTKDPFFRHPVRPPPPSCSLHKRRRPTTTTLPPLNPPWLADQCYGLTLIQIYEIYVINYDGSYLLLKFVKSSKYSCDHFYTFLFLQKFFKKNHY